MSVTCPTYHVQSRAGRWGGCVLRKSWVLPVALAYVYVSTSPSWLGVIALVRLNTPASFMIAGVYRLTVPVIAGVFLVAVVAIVLTAKALLLGVDGLGWRATAVGLTTTCALIWFALELSDGKGH